MKFPPFCGGGRASFLLLSLLSIALMTAAAPASPCHWPAAGPTPMRSADDPIIRAVWQVETQCAPDHQARLGDHGQSRGPLQCSEAAWKDADMPSGQYADVDRLEYAALVFWRYTDRWAGKQATPEQRARCWNAGPKWRSPQRTKATNGYWQEVQAALE